ncbi:MAG: hypothetical protein HYY28_07150 [Betaproteobacteria bacterium]|nr:hypothetical protein [Betaproteobacteria bacterium]
MEINTRGNPMREPGLQVTANYVSGHKVIEQRVIELQTELDGLQVANLAYAVVRANSYSQGLTKLRTLHTKGQAAFQPKYARSNGRPTVRPLTFQETIDAKVNAYESGNKELFKTCLSTSSGIVYEGTSKFKIIPLAQELVSLPRSFEGAFAQAAYALADVQELDRSASKYKYNDLLGREEALRHPAWNEAVPDKALLRAYRDIVFDELNAVHTEKAMGFWLSTDPPRDSLWALGVDLLLGCYSKAYSLDDLNGEARFIRVAQKAAGVGLAAHGGD